MNKCPGLASDKMHSGIITRILVLWLSNHVKLACFPAYEELSSSLPAMIIAFQFSHSLLLLNQGIILTLVPI